MKKKAFTLAEVLITLGIIGVIAAITVPVLVNRYQKQQNAVSLKETYSQMNQAIEQIAFKYNCIGSLKCTGLFDVENSRKFGDELAITLKMAKNCELDANKGCFANNINDKYDGTSSQVSDLDTIVDRYRFILFNGASIYIKVYSNNCENNWSSSSTGPMSKTCASIFVDVNGPTKKPNFRGIDVFQYFITNSNNLYPAGGIDDKLNGEFDRYWKLPTIYSCTEGTKDGYSCAGRIIEEGWAINY